MIDPVFSEIQLSDSTRSYAASVNTEIFPEDGMYAGNRHHYFSCGASALNCVLHTVGLSGIAAPTRVLDFGSGAGRVTRWLRAAFPGTEIHACDIRERDLEFVERAFNVRTWVSGTAVAALVPLSSYDVIWVGSVFTHLSAEVSTKLFDRLLRWLTPNGVLVFSVHGRFVLHRAKSGNNIYGLEDRWDGLVKLLQKTGYGYADYPLQQGYGISVSKSSWWINLIEKYSTVKLVCLSERAWDHHHDVIGVQHTNWS